MCGICGIFDPLNRLNKAQIKSDIPRMMGEFYYRGPDEQGTYFDPRSVIGLGHVRLSIIDFAGGRQPMANADKTLWLTFNGEIYNFQSEREALLRAGYPFQTRSDTEVILALYAHYGEDAWPRLRGQFAFGLWDGRQRKLHLVRDRLGEKPLVYCEYQNALFFASELKAILRSPVIPRELDPAVLGSYLLTQHVMAPGTLVKGLRKLPAGYALTADEKGVALTSYWRPKTTFSFSGREPQKALDEFKSIFLEAVQLCTVSDAPLGTFLSGGLDSTSVTWAVSAIRKQPFHTFAIFNQENYAHHPDWRYAQEAAAQLGTEHHNFFYDLPELMRQIPEFIAKTDEPFEGPTALVSLMLSRRAREYVKVVLTGNGADELLGGYQTYYQQVLRAQTLWQRLDRLPRAARAMLAALGGPFNDHLRKLALSPHERRIASMFQYYSRWFDLICPGEKNRTRAAMLQALNIHHSSDQADYFKRYLWDDLTVYHNHAVMTMPDATGMACSLEARNPFLDYKLVEFLQRVPPELLIRENQNKFLLTKTVESKIPSSILTRKKEGFSGMTRDQLMRWVKGEGRSLFRDHLLDSSLTALGFFNKKDTEELWRRFETAETPETANFYFIPIWASVMLDLWHRRHILQTDPGLS